MTIKLKIGDAFPKDEIDSKKTLLEIKYFTPSASELRKRLVLE